MSKKSCFIITLLVIIIITYALFSKSEKNVYADLAERMPLSSDAIKKGLMPEAGDVVVIDKGGFVRKADLANSTLVIGVVSTKPAHVLRNMIQESVPVALSGVVPCKVTDENGIIKPGDLLVASSKPGCAMKAPKQILPGSVIGKALDSQDSPEDNVLMLVMNR